MFLIHKTKKQTRKVARKQARADRARHKLERTHRRMQKVLDKAQKA